MIRNLLTLIPVFSLTTACAVEELTPEEELEIEALDQAINGNDYPAADWMVDRAVALVRWNGAAWRRFCTGTLISPTKVLTALHCQPTTNDDVAMYTENDGFDVSRRRSIIDVDSPPGTNVATEDWTDSDGDHADIVVVTLSSAATGATPATLAWTYPGPDDSGLKVGTGTHDGDANLAGELRYVADETYSDDDHDGHFYTDHNRMDPGDSGGPYYDNTRLLGVTTGAKLVWGAYRGWHTSVPQQMTFLLSQIGYVWPHGTPQSNFMRSGEIISTMIRSEKICQYACDKTSSCVAYTFNTTMSQCMLLSSVTGSASASGWRSDAK